MIDHWLDILQSLNLSDLDLQMVDTFKGNPKGRAFVSVSEILSKHSHDQDALQLLMYGVQNHPNYAAARVILAKHLLGSSIFREALDILEKSPVSLKDNKTAQILKYRLCLILGLEQKLLTVSKEMESRQQIDGEIHHIHTELQVKDFKEVRDSFLQVIKSQGLNLDQLSIEAKAKQPQSPMSEDFPKESPGEPSGPDPVLVDRLIAGFYVSPITEIFSKPEWEPTPSTDNHDLDAVTLAKIYRQQHRYQKALEIYQKLLFMAPNNDMFKKQVEELRSLREDQHRQESQYDPDLVERLDEVQQLESKIKKLYQLMSRLDEYEKRNS